MAEVGLVGVVKIPSSRMEESGPREVITFDFKLGAKRRGLIQDKVFIQLSPEQLKGVKDFSRKIGSRTLGYATVQVKNRRMYLTDFFPFGPLKHPFEKTYRGVPTGLGMGELAIHAVTEYLAQGGQYDNHIIEHYPKLTSSEMTDRLEKIGIEMDRPYSVAEYREIIQRRMRQRYGADKKVFVLKRLWRDK